MRPHPASSEPHIQGPGQKGMLPFPESTPGAPEARGQLESGLWSVRATRPSALVRDPPSAIRNPPQMPLLLKCGWSHLGSSASPPLPSAVYHHSPFP